MHILKQVARIRQCAITWHSQAKREDATTTTVPSMKVQKEERWQYKTGVSVLNCNYKTHEKKRGQSICQRIKDTTG